MRAGRLRHRVELLEPQEGASDGQGGTLPADSLIVSRPFAEVLPLAGREVLIAHQVDPRLTHHVRMRHRPGVTTRLQVRFRGRVFEIASVVDVDEQHRELLLSCVEVL